MSPHHHIPKPSSRWGRRLWYAERVWQDVVPLLALILFAMTYFALDGKVDKVDSLQQSQIEGRRIAIDVLCGGFYGVETAGQQVLTETLEGVPYPPSSKPEKQLRKKMARAYNKVISEAVIAQANGASQSEIKDLLRRDGTIDCEAVKKASRAAIGEGDG